MNKFVERLDNPKQTGDRQWVAKCPAHDDRDPSLSVAETQDGRTLIHCHAGCEALDVVHAVGLELADLFPESTDTYQARPFWWAREQRKKNDGLDVERTVLALAKADRAAGKRLSGKDLARERAAFLALKRAERGA